MGIPREETNKNREKAKLEEVMESFSGWYVNNSLGYRSNGRADN